MSCITASFSRRRIDFRQLDDEMLVGGQVARVVGLLEERKPPTVDLRGRDRRHKLQLGKRQNLKIQTTNDERRLNAAPARQLTDERRKEL